MQVRDTLADTIVDGHKRAVGRQSFLDAPGYELHIRKKRRNDRRRQVAQRLVMLFWNKQAMPRKQRPVVQESKGHPVFKNDVAPDLSSHDLTKLAALASVFKHVRLSPVSPRSKVARMEVWTSLLSPTETQRSSVSPWRGWVQILPATAV